MSIPKLWFSYNKYSQSKIAFEKESRRKIKLLIVIEMLVSDGYSEIKTSYFIADLGARKQGREILFNVSIYLFKQGSYLFVNLANAILNLFLILYSKSAI